MGPLKPLVMATFILVVQELRTPRAGVNYGNLENRLHKPE